MHGPAEKLWSLLMVYDRNIVFTKVLNDWHISMRILYSFPDAKSVISLSEGFTPLRNEPTKFPCASIANLWKFHLTEWSLTPFSASEVNHTYTGCVFYPLILTFSII